jgi:hypothetical protein
MKVEMSERVFRDVVFVGNKNKIRLRCQMSFRSVTSAESTNIIHVFIYPLNFMEVYFEFAISKHYIFIHVVIK